VSELRRCVEQLGFVGANLSPDPSGGYWTGPPLFDRYWYPLYAVAVELDVPLMIHVSAACNPHLLTSEVLTDFPALRVIIPHGGGAVPYHWGRYRGIAQDRGTTPPDELIDGNVFFDTCVYHQAGIDCLLAVIPADNVLFASEMLGAVRGLDPRTGHNYDDTRRYIDASPLPAADRTKIYETNALRVYPRLAQHLGVSHE
jgi:4-oxalmesaconate hydratase